MSSNSFPGLYLHIPFCRSKCPYCDFYSVTDLSLVTAWVAALIKEAAFYREKFDGFDTLYLGGGTPSLLTPAQLEALLAALRRYFHFTSDAEVTLEANPDDLSREKIAAYQDLGVNRLSVGIQSFNDRDLTFLGRRHTARQAVQALEGARAAGFANLSLDLMYALPGQTEKDWRETLNVALSFQPEHLSCYQLTVEAGTPLGERKTRGEFQAAGEEMEGALFLLTSEFLEDKGYFHYEVSNFAWGKKNCCRHNLKYWRHVPYLGLGPGAHSFSIVDGEDGAQGAPYIKNGVRWWNQADLEGYLKALAAGQAPVAGRETLTPEQFRLEILYLGFRTRRGVALEDLRGYGNWETALGDLEEAGLVEVVQGRAQPTRRGFLVADGLPLRFGD
ncbi:MAG: radical SAM family heme chaperone HemW [Deltaproteobacteria bacterium]|nr:radical SAM family heme chaperone HemW [Deltaproteobacteria bacterium]